MIESSTLVLRGLPGLKSLLDVLGKMIGSRSNELSTLTVSFDQRMMSRSFGDRRHSSKTRVNFRCYIVCFKQCSSKDGFRCIFGGFFCSFFSSFSNIILFLCYQKRVVKGGVGVGKGIGKRDAGIHGINVGGVHADSNSLR